MIRFGLVLHASTNEAVTEYLALPPQAAIFAGPAGTGKTHLTRSISAELLKTTTKSLVNHPYYREIAPVKQAITIDQVRNLIKFFRLKVPGKSDIKRIAVVHDADLLGIEAQNSLLKLLEEPPVGSLLMLTTSNAMGLLPTIRSRAQIITIAPPDAKDLQAYFTNEGFDASAVQKALLRHGAIAAATALTLADDTNTNDASLDLVKQVLTGSGYERLVQVDSLAKQKDQAVVFIETLATVAMASLHTAAQKGSDSIARWQGVLTAANTARTALELSGNTKLVLTELMLAL